MLKKETGCVNEVFAIKQSERKINYIRRAEIYNLRNQML